MAARQPFWKRHRWKSIGFCLWPPSTCIRSLKLKFQSKLDLCSGNHVLYRQTDGQTDGRTDGQTDRRTRWIQFTPPLTSLGGGIITEVMDFYQEIQSNVRIPCKQSSWGQYGTHLGLTGPRWAPCWPHELGYLGTRVETRSNHQNTKLNYDIKHET